jgi:hypothetical protein
MIKYAYLQIIPVLSLLFVFAGPGLAQTAAPKAASPAAPSADAKAKCGPDHKIIYSRAVGLLDKAEKKLTAGYTAEAKSAAKEAKSLFAILQKECGPSQNERTLNDKELQQEAINQKLSNDEQAQAELLMKSAGDKEKKSTQLEASQPEVSVKYQREAKSEYEMAQKRGIKAMIYAMRTDQMLFSFLK